MAMIFPHLHIHLWSCWLLVCLIALGCRERSSSREQAKLYVVATTGMVADAVAVIGGVHVVVEGLMGPGVDPHLYKATQADTRKLAEAAVIFYNGLHLEGKMGDILAQLAQSKPVYAVSEDIPLELLRHPPEFQGLSDPHIWFDVALWKRAVQKIEAVLVKHDPLHQETYRANMAAYGTRLEDLHTWAKSRIAEIPRETRVLVTAHDAFGYFGLAYNIEVVAIQGISTVSGYGVKDVERIVELLVQRKVKAVFVETSISQTSMEAVIRDCQAKGHKVIIGGSLFSDAMGEAATAEGTYLGMVRHNVNTIADSLLGRAQSLPKKE